MADAREPATSAHLRAELRRVEAERDAARQQAHEANARADRAVHSATEAWSFAKTILRAGRVSA